MPILRPLGAQSIQRQVSLPYSMPFEFSDLAIETGLLKISAAQYSALKPLNFNIGANTYALSANGQIWPRSLNTAIGGSSGSIYLVVGDVSCFVGFFLFGAGARYLIYQNRLVRTLAKVLISSTDTPSWSVSTASMTLAISEWALRPLPKPRRLPTDNSGKDKLVFVRRGS